MQNTSTGNTKHDSSDVNSGHRLNCPPFGVTQGYKFELNAPTGKPAGSWISHEPPNSLTDATIGVSNASTTASASTGKLLGISNEAPMEAQGSLCTHAPREVSPTFTYCRAISSRGYVSQA